MDDYEATFELTLRFTVDDDRQAIGILRRVTDVFDQRSTLAGFSWTGDIEIHKTGSNQPR